MTGKYANLDQIAARIVELVFHIGARHPLRLCDVLAHVEHVAFFHSDEALPQVAECAKTYRQDLVEAASTIGRAGGKARTSAKAKASRANGQKGGRPKKLHAGCI
jgi:hypothetical protein